MTRDGICYELVVDVSEWRTDWSDGSRWDADQAATTAENYIYTKKNKYSPLLQTQRPNCWCSLTYMVQNTKIYWAMQYMYTYAENDRLL